MRNKLNNASENLFRLAVLERIGQLEQKEKTSNILKKQREHLDVIDEVILYANSAPHGQIELVVTDKNFKDSESVERLLINSVYKISSFNVGDPESKKTLMRTVIILDPKWSNDFEIYHCQYGFDDSYLKKKT